MNRINILSFSAGAIFLLVSLVLLFESQLPSLAKTNTSLTGKEPARSFKPLRTNDAEPAQKKRPVNLPVKDKWALVIGISKFANPKLNLRYSDQDARDFSEFLVNEANFSKDHVRLLLNEQATQRTIISELGNKWLPRVAAPDDLVVVFISSHGSSSDLDLEGVNYIVAHDTDPEDLYATGIDMLRLMAMIKERVHSKRIVIILDACHSGAARASTKGLSRSANVDAAKIAQGTGQLVIASSMPEQVSWEFRKKPNSVFTRSLIEGLRSKGRSTTLGEAFSYMKQKVEDTVLRERGELQTPVLKSAWEGNDLILATVPEEPRSAPIVSRETVVTPSASSTANTAGGASTDTSKPGQSTGQQEASPVIAVTPADTKLIKSQNSSEDAAKGDILSDIEPDQVDLKKVVPEEPPETAAPAVRSSLRVPLPDRVAILGFSGTPEMENSLLDYMNNPIILLQHMVSTKLQSTLGRRLLNAFDSGTALARIELAGGTMYDRENIMSLGRAFKSRYLVDVKIERAYFDKKGECYFATILRVFDGETGDAIFVEGLKCDCPPFAGKASERPFYLKSVVLPAAAEQIFQSVLSVVNPQ